VLVSLKFEADYLLDCLGGIKKRIVSGFTVYDGVFGEVPVRIIKTGMGKAHIDTSLFSSCSIVVSTGVCGALTDKLRTGDIVIAEEAVFVPMKQLEGVIHGTVQDYSLCRSTLLRIKSQKYDIDSLIELISGDELWRSGLKVYRGRTITVQRVIGKPEEKLKLGSYFQAIACNMEDFFRAAQVIKAGLPFLSARAVLDELSDHVPILRGRFLPHPLKTIPLLRKLPAAQRSISKLIEILANYAL
jgi:nucleoside phosphorylase